MIPNSDCIRTCSEDGDGDSATHQLHTADKFHLQARELGGTDLPPAGRAAPQHRGKEPATQTGVTRETRCNLLFDSSHSYKDLFEIISYAFFSLFEIISYAFLS